MADGASGITEQQDGWLLRCWERLLGDVLEAGKVQNQVSRSTQIGRPHLCFQIEAVASISCFDRFFVDVVAVDFEVEFIASHGEQGSDTTANLQNGFCLRAKFVQSTQEATRIFRVALDFAEIPFQILGQRGFIFAITAIDGD